MENLEDYFLIAKIISVYDDDGYVKVKSFSDFPERFFLLDKVYIYIFGDYREFLVEDVEKIEKYIFISNDIYKVLREQNLLNKLKIEIYKELGAYERHFNQIQNVFKGLASTWFFGGFAAIGFLYSSKLDALGENKHIELFDASFFTRKIISSSFSL